MEILSSQQMRDVDRRAIDELGIPGTRLMDAAGRGVAERLERDEPRLAADGVVILCGKGNNGGDGLVAARYLAEAGIRPWIVLLARGDALRGDAADALARARHAGLDVVEAADEASWAPQRERLAAAPPVLDAILGTGVRGGARGVVATVISDLGRTDCPVYSIDLPSGVDADRGVLEGVAVQALRTYTLCRPKPALVIEPAASLAGNWSVLPIGIPDSAVAAERVILEWTDAAAAARLRPPPRPLHAHKGSFGHLLAVSGSRGKSGAAVLLARGALRSGVGLITLALPRSVQDAVASQQAEMMTEGLPESASGYLAAEAAEAIAALEPSRSALAVGPGLGTADATVQAIRTVLSRRTLPAVVDADGLNAFAADRDGPALQAGPVDLVLTPHPGEAARLVGESTATIQRDRIGAARRIALESGAVVVLKGRHTVVAEPSGRVGINASGNPGMATAGSGDVLTGVVGALLARGFAAAAAARLGAWLHGDAGDRAAGARGEDGLIASDLAEQIPAAMLALGAARPHT